MQPTVASSDLVETFAIDEFHHHEVRFTNQTCINRPHDVRTIQLAGDFNLTLKPGNELFVFRQLSGKNLNRNAAFVLAVPGLKNLAHAALADGFQQLVLTQYKAGLILQQHLRLPGRQHAFFSQLTSDGFRR